MSQPTSADEGDRREALGALVATWLRHHGPADPDGVAVEHPVVVEVETVGDGLVDVLAEVGGRLAHVVLGLRRPGEELHYLGAADQAVLGLFEAVDGLRVAVDALDDADLAPRVLAAVTGEDRPVSRVVPLARSDLGVVLAFDDRCRLTVFPWVGPGRHPGVEMLVALDEVGFKDMAGLQAAWSRGGRDLGVVQELVPGSVGGWAVALTSLRELYASGGAPEDVPGDFGPSARALGAMTARMHLALDRAFGRRPGDVAAWVARVEEVVAARHPALLETPEVAQALAALGAARLHAPMLRTHGDLHLGGTARTDQGWILLDCMAGGRPPGHPTPEFRSPLADVADLLWSLHHVAAVAAAERDPTGRLGLAPRARAWEARNRRAYLSGYLGTPGIGGLVPGDREALRRLAAVFELERAAHRDGGPVA